MNPDHVLDLRNKNVKSNDKISFITSMQPDRPHLLSTARHNRRLARQIFKVINRQPMFISYNQQSGIYERLRMKINIQPKLLNRSTFNSLIVLVI
jgi:hypothetical protein